MKKVLFALSIIAATSMVALAHGDDKSKKSCCSKDSKEATLAPGEKKSCCSKDSKEAKATTKETPKAKAKTETATPKATAAPKN